MMDGYYIVRNKTDNHILPGTLFKCLNKTITYIDSKFNYALLNNIIGASIKVSESEFKYLKEKKLSERIDFQDRGMFNKIRELRCGDEFIAKKPGRCVIVKKANDDFLVKTKEGKDRLISMWDIESVVNKEYYICLKGYPGGIVTVEDGVKKIYPDGRTTNIDADYLERISREEALFMVGCPREERLKMHEGRLWETIDKLSVGDRCCLSEDPNGSIYNILEINKKAINTEYQLRSRDSRCRTAAVFAIRPEMMARETNKTGGGSAGLSNEIQTRTLNEANDNRSNANICGNEGSVKLGSMGKATNDDRKPVGGNNVTDASAHRRGSLSSKITTENLSGVGCSVQDTTINSFLLQHKETGLKIIDTAKIKRIGDRKDKMIERILITKSDRQIVRLKWKGLLNDRICMGCELDTASAHGCDGEINGERLFKCELKKGVFIPLDGDDVAVDETCERGVGEPQHNPITKSKGKVIEEVCICCVEGVSDKGSDVILGDGISGRCKWRGRVNGADCVGVEISQSWKINGYKDGGMIERLGLFAFKSSDGALFDAADIPSVIRCDSNKVHIVIPANIRSVEGGQPYDKWLSLKQRNTELIVTLKWKGRVDGRMSLGCVLERDCEYGTYGEFRGRQLFGCPRERGVLIMLDDTVECCESGTSGDGGVVAETRHNAIKVGGGGIIDDSCICCAERRDNLTLARHITTGDAIILREGVSGTIRWTGRINGEECIGVVMDDYIRGSDGTFRGMKLFDGGNRKRSVLVQVADIPKTIKCDTIGMDVLNPTFMDDVTKHESISSHVVLRLVINVVTVQARWRANIGGKAHIGCVLPSNHKYGRPLFKFDKEIGVWIAVDSLPHGCFKEDRPHREIQMIDNRFIDEGSICCIETRDALEGAAGVTAGGRVMLMGTDYGIRGECRWKGLVNGQETVGLCLDKEQPRGSAGEFCGVRLFQGPRRRGHLCLASSVEEDLQVEIIEDKYLINKFELSRVPLRRDGALMGSLVSIQDAPVIYGRVRYRLSLREQSFLGVNVVGGDAGEHDRLFKDVLFQGGTVDGGRVLIIRETAVKKFDDGIKLLRGSNIVDERSIKVREDFESDVLKKDDVVRYEDEGGTFLGRVVRLEVLNGDRCVGVADCNAVGNSEVRYVREDAVTKTHPLKYLEDTIIDPRSVVTYKESDDDRLRLGDEVEFKLRLSQKKFRGIVVVLAEVNDVSVAAIELTVIPDRINISPYRVTDSERLGGRRISKEDNFILVPRNCIYASPKRILTCAQNNIAIFDPACVTTVSTSSAEDKVIAFTSNGERVVARLRVVGLAGKDACVGCEMMRRSPHGTNGMFRTNQLFDCGDGRGVLIPLADIKDCCVNGSHKRLQSSADGRIMEPSLCCAEMLGRLRGEAEMRLGGRVMRVREDGNIFGTCRWMGLVNKEEVIGVEARCGDGDTYGRMDPLELLCDLLGKRALFVAKDFTHDPIGLCYCTKNDVLIVDPENIKSVENGGILKKTMKCETKGKRAVVMDIRWRGVVNGAFCVGCELADESQYGTTGVFMGQALFESLLGRGALIPVDRLAGSCEHGDHRGINTHNSGSINADSICCVETLCKINRWPQMRIGSRVTHARGKFLKMFGYGKKAGKCSWMGLVNGRESVGLVMRDDIDEGTKGRFSFVDLFKCRDRRGVLFLCEDIEHDIEGETLHFVRGKFVDVSKVWKVKNIDSKNTRGPEIGGCVSTYMSEGRGARRRFNGELKWIGSIDNEDCMGIDLEDDCGCGMDGVITGKHAFECPPGRGVVTTVDNVEPNVAELEVGEDGLIDARRYLRCVEGWDDDSLRERNLTKGGEVFVVIDGSRGRKRVKGVLRWGGTMNGGAVAVVELCEDHDGGTDGTFWRQRLIKCSDKRAVAAPWGRVCEYRPYEQKDVPEDKRNFKDISINTAATYYEPSKKGLQTFYGTVRWSGTNENDEYLYGLELDDKYGDGGTDGTFRGWPLFHCQPGHGVLAPIEHVAPDTRFFEKTSKDEDVKRSEISTIVQYSIPVKHFRGEHYGIQGNANSCYFDSSIFALFSKSDVLDYLISPFLDEHESNPVSKRFRGVISREIVYPLREFGLVSFHHTMEMRDVIREYGGKFEEMTKHETDMENVAALLAKLCPDEQLLSLRSHTGNLNKGMFLQLFVILDRPVGDITSQQMLELSMAQNDIMFDVPPTCLIMQAPRDARGINCYERVLPSRTIEISNLCSPCIKTCTKCDKNAEYQCKKCITNSLDIRKGLYCERHKCRHDEIIKFRQAGPRSRDEVQMILKAIICIDKAHFVAYVKEDEFKKDWVFFDSMSTQDIGNNYAVPKVTFEKEVSHFLNQSVEEMKQQLKAYNGASLKRIVKDSYIFVYHNTAKTCY